MTLPCTRLRDHGLDDLDVEVLLVVAAPCLDASFGTIFAYLQDSFVATAPGDARDSLVATSPAQERLVARRADRSAPSAPLALPGTSPDASPARC